MPSLSFKISNISFGLYMTHWNRVGGSPGFKFSRLLHPSLPRNKLMPRNTIVSRIRDLWKSGEPQGRTETVYTPSFIRRVYTPSFIRRD